MGTFRRCQRYRWSCPDPLSYGLLCSPPRESLHTRTSGVPWRKGYSIRSRGTGHIGGVACHASLSVGRSVNSFGRSFRRTSTAPRRYYRLDSAVRRTRSRFQSRIARARLAITLCCGHPLVGPTPLSTEYDLRSSCLDGERLTEGWGQTIIIWIAVRVTPSSHPSF